MQTILDDKSNLDNKSRNIANLSNLSTIYNINDNNDIIKLSEKRKEILRKVSLLAYGTKSKWNLIEEVSKAIEEEISLIEHEPDHSKKNSKNAPSRMNSTNSNDSDMTLVETPSNETNSKLGSEDIYSIDPSKKQTYVDEPTNKQGQ